MAATLTVLYPVTAETAFDFDYYTATHVPIVHAHMGPFIETQTVIKGVAGGPDAPPGFYAIFDARFADMAKLQEALGAAGPGLAALPHYHNAQPHIANGENF